jgi:putative transposase
MKKSTKSIPARQPRQKRSVRRPRERRGAVQGLLSIQGQVRQALIVQIQDAVTAMARQLVEDEVHALVGSPWSRKETGSPLRRGGSTRTRLLLGGEPVVIERTRVRDTQAGREQSLKTVNALASRDAFDQEVQALLVRGVSTREYDAALTTISDGLGLQRSAVSAAFRRASQKDLDALNGRSLEGRTFATIYIDGIHFAETVCLVVLGVSIDGTKQVLGIREGATENAEVVSDLLADLLERGLTLPKRCLFVLDGSKALSRAVRDTFGERALVQRCLVHKLRNVLSYLPPTWHEEARRKIRAAWGLTEHSKAKAELVKVVRWLRKISESAARSLEEGLEETLTVHRLQVTGTLRRTLQTTNPIESAFDTVAHNARRVKRWRNATMVLRWAATGLVKAEQRFRRVKGHASMTSLVQALDHDALSENKSVA